MNHFVKKRLKITLPCFSSAPCIPLEAVPAGSMGMIIIDVFHIKALIFDASLHIKK
jgi:hypothetical protein